MHGPRRRDPQRFFGHISPKSFTPSYNIVLVGAVALTAGFLSLEYVVALISFGALTAFSFVNLSVLAEYMWRQAAGTVQATCSAILSPRCWAS
jgi:amino acid transporter